MKRYAQISLEEREKIYQCLKNGYSISQIASLLKRHKSSISREIKRNQSNTLGYLPDRANNFAIKRKNKILSKIEKNQSLLKYILEKLTQDKWSPEIIAGRIKMEQKLPTISHESIYAYIYSHKGQKLKLYQSLMYARPKRQLKYSRKNRIVPEEHQIKNRPEHINKRQEFGHFEGDLTFFKNSTSGSLIVLVERLSRKTFILKSNNKSSPHVMSNILALYKQLPKKIIKSITFDNGGEFKKFAPLSLMGSQIYFCDKGAPYQKGQVERTNALIHKFIPKKTAFNIITETQILNAQDKLNNLPRKNLNFFTPNEIWLNLNNHTVALHS